MILTGKEDLRVIKTVGGIKKSFEELICEKDYERITVKELCDRAQINKKTFYNYYTSLDDLLAELQFEISSSYIKRIKSLKLPDDIEKVNREFFEFSCAQGMTFEKITCSTGSLGYVRQQMINKVVSETWNKSSAFKKLDRFTREVVIEHMNSVNLNIYCHWVKEGKRLPVEKLIKLSNSLMNNGFRSVFE